MLSVPPRAWWIGGGALVVAVVVFALSRGGPAAPKGVDVDSALVGLPPLPRRVTVEVLNASGVDGLARVGMARLRRVGLDVVGTGNATAAQREAGVTMVLIRRGDSTGVGRVLAAYPKAMVRDEPSSTPLVDLTMVLGSDVVKRRKP
ncbi:MAG: LytR C-terminal domain-containing protein [Gemmatimonadales bacterium]|nr:LytR C-terminal domain-containing protein [Gemmatimonadales bacterium]